MLVDQCIDRKEECSTVGLIQRSVHARNALAPFSKAIQNHTQIVKLVANSYILCILFTRDASQKTKSAHKYQQQQQNYESLFKFKPSISIDERSLMNVRDDNCAFAMQCTKQFSFLVRSYFLRCKYVSRDEIERKQCFESGESIGEKKAVYHVGQIS